MECDFYATTTTKKLAYVEPNVMYVYNRADDGLMMAQQCEKMPFHNSECYIVRDVYLSDVHGSGATYLSAFCTRILHT